MDKEDVSEGFLAMASLSLAAASRPEAVVEHLAVVFDEIKACAHDERPGYYFPAPLRALAAFSYGVKAFMRGTTVR